MTNIKLFQDKKIRSVWNEEEEQWYFSMAEKSMTTSRNQHHILKYQITI